jgi:hypothetical protein
MSCNGHLCEAQLRQEGQMYRSPKLIAFAAASAALLAGTAEADQGKWRASLILITEDERTCGIQHLTKFDVEIKDNIIRRYAASGSGATFNFRLLAPLNADGSGKVMALDVKHREFMFDIDPGDGPRMIRFRRRNGVCTYGWRPV